MMPRAEKEKKLGKHCQVSRRKDTASIHTGQRIEKTDTRDENIPSCLVHAKALS